ncbi:CRISPR-associated endonuclease Cas2 [Candidatus Methylacidiphilum infernorum]|uniref:CRISPR-associated endoribonuclease Cas2 n=1 Tax=Methylacidiphilum infernorum (isolate V4) TaxID=481448 RepID=B3E1C7_METI4|nr:CRISPR-associated endonuclease Cas2 [Candidatus Methylacidiphilum infernorum]ACD82923.1 CRISPR-associated protein Cas2 [Methylacidiphilum infernorum V4]
MGVRQYGVAYDLSDNRERAMVERCISRYGQRLQKSLFSCVLDPKRYMQLQGELAGLRCASGNVVMAALADPVAIVQIGSVKPKAATEDWVFGHCSGLGELGSLPWKAFPSGPGHSG